MTNKQPRLASSDLFPQMARQWVGFDRLFDELTSGSSAGYPPYNIVRLTNEDSSDITYEVTLAVAGFTENDIEITVKNNQLIIAGTSGALAHEAGYDVEYLHKGIAERNFTRTFTLAEHVEVESASLVNGILRVCLVHKIPEELQPKKIEISTK